MIGALPVRLVEKPWGRDMLPPPFTAEPGRRIGEIWFEPPPELAQLLVKFIFTSDKLSVQVHPSDAQLPGHGKEECWLVIDAEPEARLGIGFRGEIGAEAMRAAALNGSIEHLLEWHPVTPGDFFYIPANTVHAIGGGISLVEVQQNSDVTWRLYDYGRARELHLNEGVAAANGERYDTARWHRLVPSRGPLTLVDGPLFRLDQVDGEVSAELDARYGQGPMLVLPLSGPAVVDGAEIPVGACALCRHLSEIDLVHSDVLLIAQPCQ
jgi:mannose-6-phosphate isomerase